MIPPLPEGLRSFFYLGVHLRWHCFYNGEELFKQHPVTQLSRDQRGILLRWMEKWN